MLSTDFSTNKLHFYFHLDL